MFGGQHVAVLVLFVLGIPAVVWLGRRVRGTGAERRVSRTIAIVIVAVTVPLQLLQLTPAEWSVRTSLPFQLCDLAWMVAVHALWTRSRVSATIAYLWGITLTTQAMITPDLVTPFPEPRFLMFWAMHVLIVWAAIYLVPGLHIVPTWRTYAWAVVATIAWAVLVFMFNVVAGTNYGFLNAKPAQGSVLDLLPAWPWYVAVQVVVVAAVWALMVLPWQRAARDEASRDDRAVPKG